MSCEHLICAQCAGPVAEGRCPVCQAARAQLHHHHHLSKARMFAAAVLLALLVMLALQVAVR